MKKKFRSFEDARKFVHLLNLKNKKEWEKYYKSGMISDDIPSNPNRNHNEEWRVGGDLLGTGFEAIETGKYRIFENTRKIYSFHKNRMPLH